MSTPIRTENIDHIQSTSHAALPPSASPALAVPVRAWLNARSAERGPDLSAVVQAFIDIIADDVELLVPEATTSR